MDTNKELENLLEGIEGVKRAAEELVESPYAFEEDLKRTIDVLLYIIERLTNTLRLADGVIGKYEMEIEKINAMIKN